MNASSKKAMDKVEENPEHEVLVEYFKGEDERPRRELLEMGHNCKRS